MQAHLFRVMGGKGIQQQLSSAKSSDLQVLGGFLEERAEQAASQWGSSTVPNKQTLSHACRNISNTTYGVGNFVKSHFKFVYVTEELN